MMFFDKKGDENYNDNAMRRPAHAYTDNLGTVMENIKAHGSYTIDEDLFISKPLKLNQPINDQLDLVYKLTGDEKYNNSLLSQQKQGAKGRGVFDANEAFYKSAETSQLIFDLQHLYPDAGLVSYEQMMEGVDKDLAERRQFLATLSERSQGGSRAAGTLAGMGAYMLDPPVLATIPFSGGFSVGRGILGNAGRSFMIEAGLAATAEVIATPFVYEWKQQINSPFELKDAVIRIMSATVGAGVIRSSASVTIDLVQLSKASIMLRKQGKTVEADVLDTYADLVKDAPTREVVDGVETLSDQDIHIIAQSKVEEDLVGGRIPDQNEIDNITGGKVDIETVDPRTVEVDAETFQFKSSGDELGVSDRLQGVTEWDPVKAGVSIIWERADGTRFIADGHQRLALAKRMIAGDEDAAEIGLNAFILRESEGVSAIQAREIAATRNIAEGSGTAIDAAKVLRAGNNFEGVLPPTSPLVRDARGLAKLDDEAFKLVIDGAVDARYGAIVGDLISDAAEQAAVIRALKKAKPANSNQAHLMVMDMRAAGFTKTETQDLFGGQEITESIFKERAKVIDSAMRQIKKDKSVFKTLAEQESRISGVGNKLDRDANLTRLSDDEKTLALLTSLANSKGPVSDAINNAARRLKSGETLQEATRELIPELKRAGDSQLNARDTDGGSTAGDEALTIKDQIEAVEQGAQPLAVIPPDMPGYSIGSYVNDKGKIITIVKIDRSKIDVTCPGFCYPELKPKGKVSKKLLEDTREKYQSKNGKYKPKRAAVHKKYIDKQLAKGTSAKAGEKPIVWIMGGGSASGKGTVLKKLQADGVIPEKGFVHADPDEAKKILDEFIKLSKNGDYRAASVVHGESSDITKALIEQTMKAKKNIIVDKTLGNVEKGLDTIKKFKDAGYDVRLVGVTIDPSEALVRALTRYFGSGRLVMSEPVLTRHKGFNAGFEKYSKEVDEALLFDNTGLEAIEIAEATNGKITIHSQEGYNQLQARGKLNEKTTTHQELRESQGLPAELERSSTQINTGGAGRVAESSDGTSSRGNDRSEQTPQNLNDQLKDTGLDLDDPYLNELSLKEQQLVDDLLATGDIDIPSGIRIDADGKAVVEFRSAKETLEELDAEQKVVDDMFSCMKGAA